MMISVGHTKIDKLRGLDDGYLLEWNEVIGMTLYALLSNPLEEEIKAITDISSSFEITFGALVDCGFIGLKFGTLPWGESAFEPRLYDSFNMPSFEAPKEGMAFSIILIDPDEDYLVKGVRLIGLGHDFSMNFSNWCNLVYQSKSSFSKEKYFSALSLIRSRLSPVDIANSAMFKWRL